MPHQSLFEKAKVCQVVDPDDYAAVAQNSVTVDTRGYENVAFILTFGELTTSIDMKAQQGDASNGSDAADISGAAITQVLAASDNGTAILDLKRGTFTKRYVRVVVTPVGAANYFGVVAVAYNREGAIPVTADSTNRELKKV